MIQEKTYSDWCRLIAWLINCDNARFLEGRKILTAEDVFNHNEYGELCFLHFLVEKLQEMFADLNKEHPISAKIKQSLEGEKLEISEKYATGLGLICLVNLWKCRPEIEELAERVFKLNHLKEKN